jgi:hypothetical protein
MYSIIVMNTNCHGLKINQRKMMLKVTLIKINWRESAYSDLISCCIKTTFKKFIFLKLKKNHFERIEMKRSTDKVLRRFH